MDVTTLSRSLRDASGLVHKRGEIVQVIRHIDQLGRDKVLIEYAGGSRGIVSPEEIEQ